MLPISWFFVWTTSSMDFPVSRGFDFSPPEIHGEMLMQFFKKWPVHAIYSMKKFLLNVGDYAMLTLHKGYSVPTTTSKKLDLQKVGWQRGYGERYRYSGVHQCWTEALCCRIEKEGTYRQVGFTNSRALTRSFCFYNSATRAFATIRRRPNESLPHFQTIRPTKHKSRKKKTS